jgi:hypothetical protein
MARWWGGFPTPVGAARVSKWGGFAVMFQAFRESLGNVTVFGVVSTPLDDAIAYFIGASLLPILLVVAGVRLWRHDSWRWGSVAAVIVLYDLGVAVFAPATMTIGAYKLAMANFVAFPSLAAEVAFVTGIIIKLAILALVVNGIRGAFALRSFERTSELRGSSPLERYP